MINFNFLRSIENCTGISLKSFDRIIEKGYIIYSHESRTYVLNSESFNELSNTKIDWFDIIEINNNFFYVCNRELFEVNFYDLKVNKIYSTKEDALYPFSNEIVSVGSSNWRTKTQHFSLIKLPNQELLNWEDRRELLCILNEVSVFYDGDLQELFAIELSNENVKWSQPFNNGISGRRYFQELPNNEFVVQKYFESGLGNLLKINLETGHIIWEIEKSIGFYNYNKTNNKLYGLGGNIFEIINVATGDREMQKQLELQVPAHLTYYADGYLYFSGYKGDNTTLIFGAVDVNTGKLAFTQSIETPNGEVNRGSYDRPIVVGNRLYIRDQQKTLHVYERDVT